jgi:hypothetical protein
MNNQAPRGRRPEFLAVLQSFAVGLAYFLGSQQDLGPRLLDGETVAGAPDSDLDLEGQRLRQQLQDRLAPLFAPVRLHLLLLEEENAHVQHAAIRGLQVYAVNDDFARDYRRRVLALYGDWHSWWP